MQALDELLGADEPFATFREAELTEVRVDYDARTLSATLSLCVGDPAAPGEAGRQRRRTGRLELTGLLLWALEPPAPAVPAARTGRPVLAEDGALEDAPTETGQVLARTIPS